MTTYEENQIFEITDNVFRTIFYLQDFDHYGITFNKETDSVKLLQFIGQYVVKLKNQEQFLKFTNDLIIKLKNETEYKSEIEKIIEWIKTDFTFTKLVNDDTISMLSARRLIVDTNFTFDYDLIEPSFDKEIYGEILVDYFKTELIYNEKINKLILNNYFILLSDNTQDKEKIKVNRIIDFVKKELKYD